MNQLALDLGHRPALGRADFLVAPGNAVAVEWIDRWPDWPARALALHGPAGSGKSHLAAVWQRRSGALAIDPSALASGEPPELLGEARACLLDDPLTALAGDVLVERRLLHLYNMLAERGGALLLAAAEPPARWPITLADLRSRLATVPTAPLGAPDDALLAKLLKKLLADRQLEAPAPVLKFLLPRMERSFAAARLLAAALDRQALADRQGITLPLARKVLARLVEQGRLPGDRDDD